MLSRSFLLILFAALASVVSGYANQAGQVAPAESGGGAKVNLASARELYAAADYQRALDVLDGIAAGNPERKDRQAIDLYRILCLIALGRQTDADKAMTELIARDPLYRPDSEMPPRVRSVFADKRKRVLPAVIQSLYQRAKDAFDRGEYKPAAEGFTEVLAALSDPDVAQKAGRPPLADLRVLATGFNDLALRSLAPPPVPPPEATTSATTSGAAVFRAPMIYDSNHPAVSAPVTLKQDVPRLQRPLLAERAAVLFIVIDERGDVESAIVTVTAGRAYDDMLVTATKTWKYRPATLDGVPVKYRKRIQLTLPRQAN